MGRFRLFHTVEATNDEDDSSREEGEILEDEDDDHYVVDSMACDDDYGDDDNMDMDMDNDHRTAVPSISSSSFWGPLVTVTTHRPQTESDHHIRTEDDNDTVTSELTNRSWYSGIAALRSRQEQSRRRRRTGSLSQDEDQEEDDYEIIQNHNNDNHPTNELEQVPEHAYDYDSPPPPSRWSWWTRVICMVLLAHLLAVYGPVAPPPNSGHDTWEEFWMRELTGVWKSAWLLGYTLPKYVGQWLLFSMAADVQHLQSRYRAYRQEQRDWQHVQAQNCSLVVPPTWEGLAYDKASTSTTNHGVVGQPRAIHVATQALDAWKLRQQQEQQQQPLLLFFAGSRGTGKLELAKHIARHVFAHCNPPNMHDNNKDAFLFSASRTSPVLMLQGRDFVSAAIANRDDSSSDDEDDDRDQTTQSPSSTTNAAARVQLYETIIQHTQLHQPHQAVIILQHVQDLPPGLLATLVHDWTRPAPTNRHHHYSYDEQDDLAVRLQQACRQSLVIMTSNVGSKTIASSIRTYGGVANIPPLDLDLLLLHELDTTFLGHDESQDDKSSTKKSGGGRQATSSNRQTKELGSKFHGVAPFFPLEQSSLELILLQKVHQWNGLAQGKDASSIGSNNNPPLVSMTPELRNILVGPARVEYLTMVQRATQTPVLTFSSAGATVLQPGSPIMNLWQAAIQRCPIQSTFNEEEEEGEEGEHLQVRLEYDDGTNQGVISVCLVNKRFGEDSNNLPGLVKEPVSSCAEHCRFPL